MESKRVPLRSGFVAFACLLGCLLPSVPSLGQIGAIGGIYIDPQGMLRDLKTLPESERRKTLDKLLVSEPGSGGAKIPEGSTLRSVSLRQWEAELQRAMNADEPIPEDLRYLSGLTKVHYVILRPQEQDVWLIGPAEAWKRNEHGSVVGHESDRAVLHWDDLVVALRYAFPPTGSTIDEFLGCSIDPTQQGQVRFNAYLRSIRNFDRRRLPQIFAGMEQAMGPHDIRLFGVPKDSRFAAALVAADYRLKRLAMGHDRSPLPEVTCFLDLAAKQFRGGAQPQHRWWFIAGYDTIWQTADQLAFELAGTGVRVATARTEQGKTNDPSSAAATAFASSATTHFAKLAATEPAFAELQNLIALSVAAQLIASHHESQTQSSVWRPSFVLADRCRLPAHGVPKQVPSLVSYRLVRGRHWLISVSGGVELNAIAAADPKKRRVSRARAINDVERFLPARNERPESSWWWDIRSPSEAAVK